MNKGNKNKIIFLLLLNCGTLGISLIYDLLFERGILGKCQFFETFGLYCLGCGGSRSLHALLDFNFLKSFIYYPPIIIVSLLILYIDIRIILSFITKKEYTLKPKIILIIPVSIVLSFVIRYLLLFLGIDPLGNILLNFNAIM